MKSDCYPLFVYPYGSILIEDSHTLKIQLSQQAKEVLGKSELVIITERVDDVALLIGQMVKMGFAGGLGPAYPPPLEAKGLSWVDGSAVAGAYSHGSDHGRCRLKPTSRA